MAREPIVLVGSLRDAYDGTVSVYAQGGDVVISVTDEEGRSLIGLPPAKLAEFRELLDRAAIPGQDGRRDDGHPLVAWAQDVARAEQEAADRDE